MPSSIVVTLSADQQASIRAQLHQARYGHLLALHILLLLSRGVCPTLIARVLFCSRSSVYRTYHAWQDGQIEIGSTTGVPRRWWGSCLTDSVRARVRDLLAQTPQALGWMRSRWSCACLALELKPLLGWTPSGETVRRWLQQSGYVWKRASLVARDDDPDRAAKLGRIRTLWQQLREDEALLFADEMDLDLLPKVGSQWCRRGERVLVPTPGKNQKAYVGAALDFRTGRVLCRTGGKKDRVLFLRVLEAVARAYPVERFRRVGVVVDNYGIHNARLVRQWLATHPQIQLVWLPRYCPKANPIERVFGDVHEAITRNHQYQELPKLVAAVLRHLRSRRWWHGTLPSIYDPQLSARLQTAA